MGNFAGAFRALRMGGMKMTTSWVIKHKESGDVIFETFNKNLISKINTEKYIAVPIREYLADLNKKIKGEK